MKITHVISDSNVGGAGILLSSLTSELKNYFDLEIIIPKGSSLLKRLPDGVKTTELPTSRDTSFNTKDVITFRDYFKSNPADIIHTHASLSARIGGKLSGGARCISTRHCAIPSAGVKKMAAAKRWLYEASTDLTVSTADFATENLVRSGLKREKIVTIKNGSKDLSGVKSKTDFSIYESLKIPYDRKIIGCVGRLEKIKGQDLLLRSAREILKFYPDTHFVFVGCGSMADEYKNLSSRLGIDKNVSFTGYVSDPSVYQKDFYINVNASRGTETSSLATSECMSLGIPTVASSFGGNREMISHRKNGMIFITDNVFSLTGAILEILDDEELYRSLSKSARVSFEENFTLSRMAESYKNLYLALCNPVCSSPNLYL